LLRKDKPDMTLKLNKPLKVWDFEA